MKKVVALLAVLLLVVVGGGLVVWQLVDDDSDGRSGTIGEKSDPTDSSSPSEGESERSDARVAPEDDLQTFYDQEIDWASCGANECATLEVPLDYGDPNGERIKLNLLKNPADGQRVGNLVVNPGGPGAPGTSYAENASYSFTRPVLDGYDIIGFDPRGTGESAPVDCLSDSDLDSYIAQDPEPDDKAEIDDYMGWVDKIGAGCADLSGDLAGHVSTAETARDIDVLRAALGDDKLNYFGASYGTKLGSYYATLFPDRTGRLVLDGAVDVNLSSRRLSLEQAGGFETALRAYVGHCNKDADCPLGTKLQPGLDRITTLLDDIDAKPLQVGDRELTAGNAFYGLILPLYNDDYWDDYLTPALEEAIDGNGRQLLALSDIYSRRSADGSYTDNSSEAIYAINCLDDSWSIPADKVKGQFKAFEKASPTLGRTFAWGLTGCAGTEVTEAASIGPIDGKDAAPLLVVGTTRDPATPMRWAEALADDLESAVLVRRDGDGHTGYNMGNDCVDSTIEDYLLEGDVPTAEVSC